jgi:hypothetical protein
MTSPYNYGPGDGGEQFRCGDGETAVHVRVTARREVTMVFFETVRWISVSPRVAFRIAYLLLKYGLIAWFKS